MKALLHLRLSRANLIRCLQTTEDYIEEIEEQIINVYGEDFHFE